MISIDCAVDTEGVEDVALVVGDNPSVGEFCRTLLFCDTGSVAHGIAGDGAVVAQSESGDFPKEAPLLIITDCECDRLTLYGRDHAFLVPRGKSLPFPPKGPVFYLE